jgi:hypothetical protein
MADTVHEHAANAGIHRRHESEPEAREPWRKNGNGQHRPPQPPLPGVFPHEIAVGHDVGSADLEDPGLVAREVESGRQVGEHVADRDRLRAHRHPPRRDHHGQALDQRTDHLKREAAGADHDGRPELDHRHAGLAQDGPGLMAAAQVGREIVVGLAEAAQIHNAPHARRPRRLAEVARRVPVGVLEAVATAHRMDEVVRRGDTPHRGIEAAAV